MVRKMGWRLLVLGACLSLQLSICAFGASISLGGSRAGEIILEEGFRDGEELAKPVFKKITNTASGVKVTWKRVKEADGYLVYRRTALENTYSIIAELDSSRSCSYTDKDVVSGSKYQYMLQAYKLAGEDVLLSGYEEKVHVFLSRVKRPTVKNTDKGIQISWKKVKGVDGYLLLRYTPDSDDFMFLGYVDGSRTSCIDSGAFDGKSYAYALQAVKVIEEVQYLSTNKVLKSDFITCHRSTNEMEVDENQVVYRALLIGESDYSHVELHLENLGGPVFDIQAMNVALMDMKYTRVDGKLDVSKAEIFNSIQDTFQEADGNDVSLFYFSGHGGTMKDATYSGGLVTVDGKIIAPYELADALKAVPGRVVVLLDCCGSGASITSPQEIEESDTGKAALKAFNQQLCSAFAQRDVVNTSKYGELMDEHKFHVITAAKPWQESVELRTILETKFGLFTYGILMGAGYVHWHPLYYTGRQPADQNSDHCVSLEEAYRYGVQELNRLEAVQTLMRYPKNDKLVIFMHK